MTVTPERLGDCRLLEVIGQGPLTLVYRGLQEPLGRPVTVKALRPSIAVTSTLAQQLEREAHLLSSLRHAGIVTLYDFVRHDDGMWLVLEHVAGPTLAVLLERTGSRGLGPAASISIALALAEALGHAHERGVIHRDLRPEHVQLSTDGDVKLGDFAVAQGERLPSSPEPLGSVGFGSPAHLAPEQVLGETTDARSDLFSLGIVLYRMLGGVHPFEAPDARSVTQRIRHDAPTPLLRVAPQVPPPLERIVARCLEKSPDRRFPSAEALTVALRRVATDLDLPTGRREIAAVLGRSGLAGPKPSAVPARPSVPPRREGIVRAALGQLFVLLSMILGGSAIQSSAPGVDSGFDRQEALELTPEKPAALRVLARPWASVYVDGQFVDVTPFARPIPLRAGEHEVLLRHPSAPDERRFIKPALHETVLVEAEMKVPPAPVRSAPPVVALPPVSSSPGP